MENENLAVKKKQNKLIYIILFVFVVVFAFYYFVSEFQQDNKKNEVSFKKTSFKKENFDGVTDELFNKKLTNDALRVNNSKTDTLEKKIELLTKQLENNQKTINDLTIKLHEQSEVVSNLKEGHKEIANNVSPKNSNVNLNFNLGNLENSQINEKNENAKFLALDLSKRNLKSSSFKIVSDQNISDENKLPYIPSGSFARALIIEGADANASVTGNNNTNPIQFRLIDDVQMPNDESFNLKGCFITAEVYGDISSERGEVRTRKISCKLNDKTVDMAFQGHVSFNGKNGIKGTPVMRNGKIVALAGFSGFLGGLGSNASSLTTQQVGVGAVAQKNVQEVFTGALAGGIEKASNTLSEYYIKRAEQYHPIIEIGAGSEVTVVFQDGFQLFYVEDNVEKNQKNSTGKKTLNNGNFDVNKTIKNANNVVDNINDIKNATDINNLNDLNLENYFQ